MGIQQGDIEVLTSFKDVNPFLKTVRSKADANRKALGFLPANAYEESAYQGKLWVAVLPKAECLGHLLFGGQFPSLKVFQLMVYPQFRRFGVGSRLVDSLIKYGEERSYISIIAQVASDLAANRFWEKRGFSLIRQKEGGKARRRTINVRGLELNTPSLLRMMASPIPQPAASLDGIRYAGRPLMWSRSYILDINVFFDVVKDRHHGKEAAVLFNAGFNNQVQIRVTAEFVRELERNQSEKPDPVLQIAKQLPSLPAVPDSAMTSLLTELRSMIFPQKEPAECSDQDNSDLRHLASTIYHRATGFVTREKAILLSSEALRAAYDIDVVAPSSFLDPSAADAWIPSRVSAVVEDTKLAISTASESDRDDAERFLVERGLKQDELGAVWGSGATGARRRRLCARISGRIVGVASWDAPTQFHFDSKVFLYVDETHTASRTFVEHALGSALGDGQDGSTRRLVLVTLPDQVQIRELASERGFIPSADRQAESHHGTLAKVVHQGALFPEQWHTFAEQFERLTGLRLPSGLPTKSEFVQKGVAITDLNCKTGASLKLFDFETLISPCVVMCPGREGIILPIRSSYASDLFDGIDPQGQMFSQKEAVLRIEKAYFRSPAKARLFETGTPIVFYVSGSAGGPKEAIGVARTTYSEVMNVGEVETRLARQGVLDAAALRGIGDKRGRLHVLTFDNFALFPHGVSFRTMRKHDWVSGANLVTAERLGSEALLGICRMGYGDIQK